MQSFVSYDNWYPFGDQPSTIRVNLASHLLSISVKLINFVPSISASWWMARPLESSETLNPYIGVPYLKNQAMMLYSSLWNANNWATRGELVKTHWTKSSFHCVLQKPLRPIPACIWTSGTSSCDSKSPSSRSSNNWWQSEEAKTARQHI